MQATVVRWQTQRGEGESRFGLASLDHTLVSRRALSGLNPLVVSH